MRTAPRRDPRLALSYVALAALSALASCGTSPPPPSGDARAPAARAEPTSPVAIGGPCRHDLDCIPGAACTYYTCDFRGPCVNTKTRLATAEVTVERYRYDAEGRSLGVTATANDQVTRRDVTTWSEDGRVATTHSWYSAPGERPADAVTVEVHRADGLSERVETRMNGHLSTQRFTWAPDWSCVAPRIALEDDGVPSELTPVCDGDGHVTAYRAGGPAGQVYKRYAWSEGRVASITRNFPGAPPHLTPMTQRYLRDERGSIVGIDQDNGGDGTIDWTERYDLSCWSVVDGRVRHTQTAGEE